MSRTAMPSVIVCLTSHNELTRRGEAVLRRSLDSLTAAMDHVARYRPEVDVYVACCDDASTDAIGNPTRIIISFDNTRASEC